jgi:hypothetical protein
MQSSTLLYTCSSCYVVKDMDLRPARKPIHDGAVKAIVKSSDARPRYLYLLSDMLLVGKPRGENSYKLKAQLFLAETWINPTPSGSHSVRSSVR